MPRFVCSRPSTTLGNDLRRCCAAKRYGRRQATTGRFSESEGAGSHNVGGLAPPSTCEATSVEGDLSMVFPTRDEIRKALLLALADGGSHYSDDVEVAVADILGLSDSQRHARAGNGTRLGNEIDWIKGAGDMGLGLFERVGPKLYRLTPYRRSAAAGDIDPDAMRTIHGRASSPPTDLEERLDEDAETLKHDPNNIAVLNRIARRYLKRGESARAIGRSNVSSQSIPRTPSPPNGSASCDGDRFRTTITPPPGKSGGRRGSIRPRKPKVVSAVGRPTPLPATKRPAGRFGRRWRGGAERADIRADAHGTTRRSGAARAGELRHPSVKGSRVPPLSSTHTDLFSRYSLIASSPFSRPRPESPKPPNGTLGATTR